MGRMNKYYIESRKEVKDIVHATKRRKAIWKANWIGHIFRSNCLLTHIIEGQIGDEKTRKKT
jgi:hypothetical protein